MNFPLTPDVPPFVHIHHAKVVESDVDRMSSTLGKMGYMVISVQPTSSECFSKTFWITAAKVENCALRLEEESRKNICMHHIFGPYLNNLN